MVNQKKMDKAKKKKIENLDNEKKTKAEFETEKVDTIMLTW